MKLLRLTPRVGKKYHSHNGTRPQSERELVALRATALDTNRFPILATHFWSGPLLVNGVLCCQDHSPLTRQFKAVPLIELKEIGQ